MVPQSLKSPRLLGDIVPKHVTQAAPGLTKVLFENDRIRVVELKVKKGAKAEMHTHPAYLTYTMTAFEYKSTPAGGKTEHRKLKAGEVDWSDGESHAVEFVAPGRALVIELK